MSKYTARGLVEHAEKALKENWGYCLGTWGQTLTETLLAQKCSQGSGVGTYNTSHKAYLNKFLGKRVSDCFGIAKGYVWWQEDNSNPGYAINGFPDWNQESAYNAAKEKGSLSSLPEIPGIGLWMKGHFGVYIGNGEFIECMGAPNGMKKGKIENGKIVSGSKFTNWFKLTWLDYEEDELTMEQYNELKELITKLNNRLDSIEDTLSTINVARYQTIGKVPEWGKATVTKCIDKGLFADENNLDITYNLLRTLVILDRNGSI